MLSISHLFLKEEVYFWPSNYRRSLVLAIKPENQESSTIELLKPFTIGPRAVLVAGFADVDSTWWWDPPVCLIYLFSLYPSLFLLSSLFVEHSRSQPPQRARGRAAGRAATLCSANVVGRVSWISALGRRGRPSELAAAPGELELRLGPALLAERARAPRHASAASGARWSSASAAVGWASSSSAAMGGA
jgi:hypothetical protein